MNERRERSGGPTIAAARVRAARAEEARAGCPWGGDGLLLRHALPFLRGCLSNPLRILDLACGGGERLRLIVRALRREQRPVQAVGLEPEACLLQWARHRSRDYPEVVFARADPRYPCCYPQAFDLVMLCSPLHRLPTDEAVALLREVYALSRGLLIVAETGRSSRLRRLLEALPAMAMRAAAESDAAPAPRGRCKAEGLAELARAAGVGPFRLHPSGWRPAMLTFP